jgi:hypothetical protein
MNGLFLHETVPDELQIAVVKRISLVFMIFSFAGCLPVGWRMAMGFSSTHPQESSLNRA